MVIPSALSPRTRVLLAKDQPHTYNEIYATIEALPVWERLTIDASERQHRTKTRKQYKDKPETVFAESSYRLQSGFVSNHLDTFARTRPHFSNTLAVPVESLHPIQAKRMKQREPIEFMTSIRPPAAKTMNQTLRMMGTYETDLEHARRFKIQVPEQLLRKQNFFHPDVIVDPLQTRSTVTVHPKWKTAEDSGHFQYIRAQPGVNEPQSSTRRIAPPGEMEVKGFRRQPSWKK